MFSRGGKENSGKENTDKDNRQKIDPKKAGAIVGGVVVGTATATILGTEIYKSIGRKQEYETANLLRKEFVSQSYEVLSNSNIDEKIRKKTEEIETLKKRLDEKKKELENKKRKIKKKELEEICNLLSLRIQNKSCSLDFLKKQKELQKSMSQNMSKRNELIAEKENISVLHPGKKKKLANEINEYDSNVKNDIERHNNLERIISEVEQEENVLAEEYKKVIVGNGIKFFKSALVVIGICLICGMIAYFGIYIR